MVRSRTTDPAEQRAVDLARLAAQRLQRRYALDHCAAALGTVRVQSRVPGERQMYEVGIEVLREVGARPELLRAMVERALLKDNERKS